MIRSDKSLKRNESRYVLWLLSLKPLWRVNIVSFFMSSYLFGPQILGKPATVNVAVFLALFKTPWPPPPFILNILVAMF